MRALQITAIGSPLDELRLSEPEPGSGEVVVRIEAAGICRSDVHYRSGHRPMGTCGRCAACHRGAEQFCEVGEMIGLDRQGGYAEAIAVPASNALLIPAPVSTEAAAGMLCSTATVLHALRRATLQPGERVAVLGAGGRGGSAGRG